MLSSTTFEKFEEKQMKSEIVEVVVVEKEKGICHSTSFLIIIFCIIYALSGKIIITEKH